MYKSVLPYAPIAILTEYLEIFWQNKRMEERVVRGRGRQRMSRKRKRKSVMNIFYIDFLVRQLRKSAMNVFYIHFLVRQLRLHSEDTDDKILKHIKYMMVRKCKPE